MATDDKQGQKSQVLANALPVGTVLASKSREYKVVGVLGAGGFGITYKVSSQVKVGNVELKNFFAVKEFFIKGCYRGENRTQVLCAPTTKKDFEDGRKDFRIEAERLNKLGRMSSNIVKVNEVFFANDTVYYVMEYLEGGDLVHCIKANGNRPLSEARAVAIMLPIIRAVEQLHKERLLHMDIKPDNIVLKKGGEGESAEPVLIDFGIAKHFDHSGRPTSHLVAKGASDGYAPMEQYSDIDTFAPEIDVYAIGATLYYLLTAENPPKAFDVHFVSDLIARIPGNVSERTKKVIAGAMQPSRFARTHDAGTLLRALSESYTLPAGYVLHGRHADYRIVEVEGETDCSITYKAVVSRSLKGDAAGQASGANGTRVAVCYLVHEFFLKHADKRGDDGTVLPAPSGRDASSFLLEVGREISPNSLGQLDGHGNVLAEKFEANGTLYFVGIDRSKNTKSRVKARKKSASGQAAERVTLKEAIRTGYSRYATFSGRASRAEHWYWYLYVQVITFSLEFLAFAFYWDLAFLLGCVWNLVHLLPSLAVSARRLHDTNRSGRWLFMISPVILAAVPILILQMFGLFLFLAGSVVLLVWLCQSGDPGANEYGGNVRSKNPVGRDAADRAKAQRKWILFAGIVAAVIIGFLYFRWNYPDWCFHKGLEADWDRNYSQAVSWYRKAAEQGRVDAQWVLGRCYYEGEGVTKDYSQAVFWYRKAAEQGHAGAQYNLGICYENGEGVAQDYSQAVSWYRKSAEQGNALAQYMLARCYYNGKGVTKDLGQAKFWARKAVIGNISEQQKSTLKKLRLVE